MYNKIGHRYTVLHIYYALNISSLKPIQRGLSDILTVRNHVKLEIRSFVMNFNSEGFSLRILYCVVDTGYGLGRSLGDCRPALPKGRKYQMVKTESHNRWPIV